MSRITNISRKLFDDWFNKMPYETLSGDLSLGGIDQAYAAQSTIQDLFSKTRGEIAGRKIALASKAMQQMCGIDHPIAGAIFARDVCGTGTQVSLSGFQHLGLEFELALELKRDVPPQTDPHNAATVGGFIAAARPAFEIIEDKNADYSQLDVFTMIADNAWCGGVVLGPEIDGWRGMELGNIPSCVYQQGAAPEATNTGAADPLGSLAWVLNHFSKRGITLSEGEQIITGSAVRTRFPVAGDKFSYDVAGAIVEVEFTWAS
ncbi:MAG: 2-keto-4-pentenoate hydratase [Paracoccaceae bacterium]|jgi:2-keto-4-pentenoate hydratase